MLTMFSLKRERMKASNYGLGRDETCANYRSLLKEGAKRTASYGGSIPPLEFAASRGALSLVISPSCFTSLSFDQRQL